MKIVGVSVCLKHITMTTQNHLKLIGFAGNATQEGIVDAILYLKAPNLIHRWCR